MWRQRLDVVGETKEEPQEGQALNDEGDPDLTPEEAESAYEQAGNDNCDQKPNPKYGCLVKLIMKSLLLVASSSSSSSSNSSSSSSSRITTTITTTKNITIIIMIFN